MSYIIILTCAFPLQYGNLWRTAGDITQSWPEIMRVLDSSVGLMKYSKQHAWADMDMLEVNHDLGRQKLYPCQTTQMS